jgi:hypothetical protein
MDAFTLPAVRARFPVALNLPEADPELVTDAAAAINREYQCSVRWRRLRCRNVEPLDGACHIYVLDVGQMIEFDWTWEGAVAFRPPGPDNFDGNVDRTDDFAEPTPGNGHGDGLCRVWAGEVVGVDETQGRLFVSIPSPECRPCRGTFFVRPFEFLAFLHALYYEPAGRDLQRLLPPRLNAARGEVHPPVVSGSGFGMEELERLQMWRHSWGVLWGPPGCGKTTHIGRLVATCLADPTERILVVSSTNRATDTAAVAIGRAALAGPREAVRDGRALRIGTGANYAAFAAEGLEGMLRGTETELLRQIAALALQLERTNEPEAQAVLRCRIQDLRRSMTDRAFNVFVSPDVRVVIATAFKGVGLLSDPAIRALAAGGEAPFTTVVIDEAGLMSRSVVAGLSLLAARRVIVVGDARQLAPISKVSRVLPTAQACWLASSALTHLQRVGQVRPGVHLLREQHRMHPDIRRVVSDYQYEGKITDAQTVAERPSALPTLVGQPRAVWYVLDEDGQDLPAIRAERGPGNRSWVRRATREVLGKLFGIPAIRGARGLFVTPFRAQARDIASFLAGFEELGEWSAGTVHGRQGTEADVVVFDTVNAGSCGWPYDEWQRLVNVGISRAREFVLVVASRAEMGEPYLRPLLDTLAPRVLRRDRRGLRWEEVPARPAATVVPTADADPTLLGPQLARRKALRPVMSAEQQRLCGYTLDGKPRLVRGVAGSGKTVVLAHWLQRTVRELAGRPDARVWAVYANGALRRLIADTVAEAWRAEGGSGPFPWDRVELLHVGDILELVLPEVGLRRWQGDRERFEYDAMAAEYLKRQPFESIRPRCHAMFVDEAQDMGPNTLRLLTGLVERTSPANPKGRAVHIFYDNAQNIYGRATPKWSEIGLDMIGRSTVMKESFRSTRPIAEFALNVLYRLQPPDHDPDHRELVERGLVEQTQRNGRPWWAVRFNQVDGPPPEFRRFATLDAQIDAIGARVVRWVRDEGVRSGDICVLYNGRNILHRLQQVVDPMLREVGSRLVALGDQGWDRPEDAVLVSTSHSFKGYDSEIVLLAGTEQFIAKERGILANNLYVAMTRARSVLAVYAYARKNPNSDTQTLLATLSECSDALRTCPRVDEVSSLDDFEDLLGRLGGSHRHWFEELWKSYRVRQEPILAGDDEILAEPLFWFRADDRTFACFGVSEPGAHTRHNLEDHRIEVIRPGEELPRSAV